MSVCIYAYEIWIITREFSFNINNYDIPFKMSEYYILFFTYICFPYSSQPPWNKAIILWSNVETTEAKKLKSPNPQSLQIELYMNVRTSVFKPLLFELHPGFSPH